jgi:hypothetical protein
MAQYAGINYSTNAANCRISNSEACTVSGYIYSATYNCYTSGGSYKIPTACMIGTVDPCPTCSTSSDSLGVNSIDPALLSYMFGSAVLFWSIGLGIGLIIAQIRKTRV